MSTTDEAPTAEAPAVAAVGTGIADPAPLGLAAFALTTFLLSVINAGWAKSSTGFDWWGYAIAYGGLIQLLAGMWEFRNRNVFGATAFSTYGGFWIGVGLWLHFIAPTATNPVALNRDLGWILLSFAIFNAYMLIIATQLNMGARALTFDIASDSKGGLYAHPSGALMAMELMSDPYVHDMSQPGFKVLHILDIDFESSCMTLARSVPSASPMARSFNPW